VPPAPRRPNGQTRALTILLLLVASIVTIYSFGFHALMLREHRAFSWLTSVYWTAQTMTTLGYGDIVFHSDLGRAFSMLVLSTGVVLLFVLLPFTLIQFVYAPWLEARNAARTPRQLPASVSGHVILINYGPVEATLIERLTEFNLPYVVIVDDTTRALELHDQGVRVMVGRVDSVDTYRRAQVAQASLVAATRDGMANASVMLTVRKGSETVPIVATAGWETSAELFRQAGCQQVIQLGELVGRELARRIAGRGGGRTHVVAELDGLRIAEASAAGTSLVGLTIRDSALRQRFNVNVVGLWQRGVYLPGSASTVITEDMTLLLSGTPEGLDAYDLGIRARELPPSFAIVIGAGRVGRATSRHLTAAGIEHTVVERSHERMKGDEPKRYLVGDATDPQVLKTAGIERAASIAITTHDDDVNVYLSLYCRSTYPGLHILSRATAEQNAPTLRRAGADSVLSYVPMEATAIFEIVHRGNLLLLDEGIEVFTVLVPATLVGKAIADCALRETTGCNVFAVRRPGEGASYPDINMPLEAGAELILIGDRADERRFFERFGARN
jgi:voltage-gated potassium channel